MIHKQTGNKLVELTLNNKTSVYLFKEHDTAIAIAQMLDQINPNSRIIILENMLDNNWVVRIDREFYVDLTKVEDCQVSWDDLEQRLDNIRLKLDILEDKLINACGVSND